MVGNSYEFLGISSPNLLWKLTPLFLGIPKKILGIPRNSKSHFTREVSIRGLFLIQYQISKENKENS